MSLFDDLNVLVITKHGFLKYIKHDLGMRAGLDDPDCPYPEGLEGNDAALFHSHQDACHAKRCAVADEEDTQNRTAGARHHDTTEQEHDYHS